MCVCPSGHCPPTLPRCCHAPHPVSLAPRTYPRLPLLAPATPLLPLVRTCDRYLSRSSFLWLASAMVGESRALSCRATTLLSPRCAFSPPPGSGRSPLLLARRANLAAAVQASVAACFQAARRGGRRWSGPGQTQAQLATPGRAHHPRPLAG
jgi:hypothetical protein